jgi:DNA-binding transcriptional regulator YhcF (GntR family)
MLQAGQSARRVAGTFRVAPNAITRLLNRFTVTNSVTDKARSGTNVMNSGHIKNRNHVARANEA